MVTGLAGIAQYGRVSVMSFVITASVLILMPPIVWSVLNMHIEMIQLDSAFVTLISAGEVLAAILSIKASVIRFAMAVEDLGHGIVMSV
jgi:hypothetical protein